MIDIVTLIKTVGYLGIAGIVYAETGLLAGMFLPGDSLLFTAGFLASQGHLNIVLLCILTGASAILGDNTGYWLGRTLGPRIFARKKSVLFSQESVGYVSSFYKDHGAKTVVMARFLPIVRTIAPTLAGVGKMRYRTFLAFSVIGGILWGVGVPVAGYWLGTVIPGVDRYLIPIIAAIIVISVSPGFYKFLRRANNRRMLKEKILSWFS